MAFTLGNVIADARVDLNDRNGVRWSAADMLTNANTALQEVVGLRPDLIFGSIATGQPALTETDPVPLPDRYRQALSLNVQSQCYRLNTDRGSYDKANDLYAGFINLVSSL
jgi:hypothetical protein